MIVVNNCNQVSFIRGKTFLVGVCTQKCCYAIWLYLLCLVDFNQILVDNTAFTPIDT